MNTLVTAGLGYVFMVVASRLYEPAEFGQAQALVSAMMLLASMAELNLGLALPRFLPQLGARTAKTVVVAYSCSTVVAIALAGLFVLVVPSIADSFSFLGDSKALAVTLIGAVVLWNIFGVQDGVLTALRRASWIPIENGIFGVAKIVLMVAWASGNAQHGMFYAWVVPMAVLVVPVTVLMFTVAIPRYIRQTVGNVPVEKTFLGRREITRYLGMDYVASLLSQAAFTALPLFVVVVIGAEANASFAIAYTVVVAVEQLSMNAGLSLLVEGALNRNQLPMLVRHTFRRLGLLLFVVIGGLAIATPLILFPYDDPYPDTVPTVLRLLLLGLVPQAIVIIYQAVERVRGNAGRVVLSTLAQAVSNIAGVVIGGQLLGLAGVGWGWVLANLLVAVCVAPLLLRVVIAGRVR